MQCFTIFSSNYSKLYATTTTSHRKRLIQLLKERKVLTLSLSTIFEKLMVVLSSIDMHLQYIL